MSLEASELTLNPDFSVYHLALRAEHIADKVIVVGDQNRVALVSAFFDTIECKIEKREFVTHTGTYKGKRITVLSTGIGTDNIDIVLNELDAAVNIDPRNKQLVDKLRTLQIIRIGTCGALHSHTPVHSHIASLHAIGLDGVLNYYQYTHNDQQNQILKAYLSIMGDYKKMNSPYVSSCDLELLHTVAFDMHKGITATANGFYGPQGRVLRLPIQKENFNDALTDFSLDDLRILNYEMETSTLFGLSHLLNHRALTVCLVVANRALKTFSENYKPHMIGLIEKVLDRF